MDIFHRPSSTNQQLNHHLSPRLSAQGPMLYTLCFLYYALAACNSQPNVLNLTFIPHGGGFPATKRSYSKVVAV